METTVGWTSFGQFGHVSEPLTNALASSHHVLSQTRKLWFSAVCKGQCTLPGDAFHGLSIQKSGSKVALSECSLRQDNLITLPTSLEESFFKLAAENAYNLALIEPLMAESMALKSHPNKRRFFPANGASVLKGNSHSMFGANTRLASASGEYALEYTSGPSDGVVICFKCLELTGMPLSKCLKNAWGVSEDDLVSLLKILSSNGFQRSEIKAMFSKYPPLVKVKGPQVEQCLQYYSGLGFIRSVTTSLLLKRPALLSCDLKRASQVIDYLVSMGTRKEDLSAIIACRPHILERDVAVVKSIVSALLKARLDQSDINKLIKRAPTVFTLAEEDIKRSLRFWSKVGVEGKALYRAILRRPNLLSYNTESMLSTYTYLQRWFEPSDLIKLVSRFAELLAHDPPTKLKPLINYFLELGLREGEVAKVILRRPQLMTCTLERLKRVTEFLKCIGVKDDMVGKILITSPQVFTLNAEDKLKRGVEFFRSMGLDKERDMEFVFARSAQLFCCSIEKNLLPTFQFFSNIGLEKGALATMIVSFPSMLGQSIESSLAPKYEYLIGEMKRTNQELVEFPQYFGYSLEGRIKPRHRLLAERGLSKSLPSMLACTDHDFHKRYTEAYSPLPQQISPISKGDAVQQILPKKQKLKTKRGVIPPDFQERYTEAYSPVPHQIAPISKGDAQQICLKKQELKTKRGVIPPDFQERYTEAYSPVPHQIAPISKGDAVQQICLKKQKLKTNRGVIPPAKVQSEPVQQNPSPLPSEQETLPMDHGPEVLTAENQIHVMHEDWEFLSLLPRLHEQQSHVYPACFKKHYKNLTPCGMWIHAYKFDS